MPEQSIIPQGRFMAAQFALLRGEGGATSRSHPGTRVRPLFI